MGLSPSVVASCAGLVRQLQVNNYRRKSASVTDVSVRPVWCRLAWTLPRYRARLPRTGYRPSTAAGASLHPAGVSVSKSSSVAVDVRGAGRRLRRCGDGTGRSALERPSGPQRAERGRAESSGQGATGMCTDEAMWECQIQFPKLSPRCEVSSSNNSCGIERAFRRPRARPRGGATPSTVPVFGPLRVGGSTIIFLRSYILWSS